MMAMNNNIRTKRIIIEPCSSVNIYLPFNIKLIPKCIKCCKDMYRVFNTKIIISKGQQNWNNIFENVNLKWTLIYKLPSKSCNNTLVPVSYFT